MKKLILLLFLLLPLPGAALALDGRIPKARIASFITEYRHCEGVEVVRLGRIATAALKGAIRIAARKDPDSRDILNLTKDIRGLYVFEYGDCAPALREKIGRRLDRLFNDSAMLMEASDGGQRMQIYGLYDELTESVRDFVMYNPADCTLICVFGSFSMEAVSRMMNHD